MSESAVRVYTGRWHLVRVVQPGAIVPVRTSLGAARFIPGAGRLPAIAELTPTPELFRIQDAAEFTRQYRATLDRHGVAVIQGRFDELHERNPGRPLVLLCFEEDRRDCHRGDFAEWWEEKTGVCIPEYTAETATALRTQEHAVLRRFRGAAIRAQRAGTCRLCATRFSTGEVIVQLGKRRHWAHLGCVERGLQDLIEEHG
jgi:hypothetical protein